MKCPNCSTSLVRLSERSEPEGIRHDAYCKKCNKTFEVHKSGLMEKKIYHTDPCTWKDCTICSPSPEARVDWEKEAREILREVWGLGHMGRTVGRSLEDSREYDIEDGVKKIAKSISAAFEKGREAR